MFYYLKEMKQQDALNFSELKKLLHRAARDATKASKIIKCCDRIPDAEVALRTALEKLQKFFGNLSMIIEAHISYVI